MGKRTSRPVDLPTAEQLATERRRLRYKSKYSRTLRSTVAILVVVAALAVLIATLWMPVLRIYGSSMSPTLQDGQIVVSIKSSRFEPGDIAAFYHGNKLLIKRYIAGPGQWVDIDENGNVFVDGSLLDEPYLMEKAYGQTNIELPYQVPDERYFLMGDNRDVSVDSRNTTVGCVSTEQIVGKVIFRIWPLNVFGPVYFDNVINVTKHAQKRKEMRYRHAETSAGSDNQLSENTSPKEKMAPRRDGALLHRRVLHDLCADPSSGYNVAAAVLRKGRAYPRS